jgi:hypothetical protein
MIVDAARMRSQHPGSGKLLERYNVVTSLLWLRSVAVRCAELSASSGGRGPNDRGRLAERGRACEDQGVL